MEREKPEVGFSPSYETAKTAETSEGVDVLPERVGFVETAELQELRGELVAAMTANTEDVGRLVDAYHVLGREIAESQEMQGGADAYDRAQIGLLVSLALVRRESGRMDDYVNDLEDALQYARGAGHDDIIAWLETELEQFYEPQPE